MPESDLVMVVFLLIIVVGIGAIIFFNYLFSRKGANAKQKHSAIGKREPNHKFEASYKDNVICAYVTLYEKCYNILDKSPIVKDYEFEFFPFLYVISDYAVASSSKRREETLDILVKTILSEFLYTDDERNDFSRRVDFYGEIIRGKRLRASWDICGNVTGQNEVEENALLRCTIAFCDLITNPALKFDYDGAEAVLFGILESTEFIINVFTPLYSLATTDFKVFYNLSSGVYQ